MNIGRDLTTSVRHRVLRHALRKLGLADLPKLGPGQMQLYSFYTPGLPGGLYDIHTEQTIRTPGDVKYIVPPPQSFFVTAPRFSIDAELIHSSFPLPGVSAYPNILPHIIFNDPHLPWQRQTEAGATKDDDVMRIPWLAVVAFEQSELRLTPEDHIFSPDSPQKQSFNLAVSMTLDKLTNSGLKCAVPDLKHAFAEDPKAKDMAVDVIFPKMDLFLALFSDGADSPSIDIDRFKYLAHVRQVNTDHMTESGILDEGIFSIVLSHRTGPLFNKEAREKSPPVPTPCVVHVVSLDAVEHIPKDSLTGYEHAALISLYSWTYDCLPPSTINFEDVMRKVGKNSYPFNTPEKTRESTGGDLPPELRTRIQDRLEDGYTLLRYRVQTGEETVALTRGPLTPHQNRDVYWFDIHSNTGEDLQIIDTQLGLMDLSYCTAWQLGKSLAIADQAFCASLLRIRADVHNESDGKTKEEILSNHFDAATSTRVIESLPDTLKKMNNLGVDKPEELRYSRPKLIQSRYEFLSGGASRDELYQTHLIKRVRALASAADGGHFTEMKEPCSTDWSLVLNWLMDKIFLEGIPPHYLIPDPTWLPSECIRFFYVDQKWLSALVDGALSVSNHLDKDDITRRAIKVQLLKYLKEDIHSILKHPPLVPRYGFYLRSVAVDAFPDLVVRAPRSLASDLRPEVLRQDNVRKDVMMCLLDRTPSDLDHVVISQPPHQQCFAFGHDGAFTEDSLMIELRKVFSVPTTKKIGELPEVVFNHDSDGKCDVFDWNWRTVRLDNFAAFVLEMLQKARETDPEIYDGDVTNSALLGTELNDPIYRLTFSGPNAPSLQSMLSVNYYTNTITFDLPAESVSAASSDDDYALPFKIKPQSSRQRGPPRRTKLPLPSLLRDGHSPTGQPISTPTPTAPAPKVRRDNYDDIDTCPFRFDPLCFTLGHVPSPIPGDQDTKFVDVGPDGTDILFRFIRNSADDDSTDSINTIKVTIPLGDTSSADCLITIAPATYDGRMINNTRVLPIIRNYEDSVTVELKPKTENGLTLLAHSLDVSFVIKGARVNPNASGVTIPIVELYTSKEGNLKVAKNQIHNVAARK